MCCGGLAGPCAAQAPALEISPISVRMLPDQLATTLAVTNTGTEATTVQLRPFLWDQPGGVDRLVPTAALVVSPPITEIDPGQTQTFRLVLQNPAAVAEASYRLLLDQLPPAAAPGSVRVALRVSMPVFAEPEAAVPARLSWSIARDGNGLCLVARNLGGEHARVYRPVLNGAGAPLALGEQRTAYILAGTEKRWPMPQAAGLRAGLSLRLAANSDTGPVSEQLDVP